MYDLFEIRRLVFPILRAWWFVVILTAVGFYAGNLYSNRMTPVYQATSTLMVGNVSELNTLNRTDILNSEVIIQTYADIVRRQPILEEVVQQTDLGITWQQLNKRVKVNPVEGTQLMEIKVEANTVNEAVELADLISNQLLLATNIDDQNSDLAQVFMRNQANDLRSRITEAQARIEELDAELETSESPDRRAEIQVEVLSLQDSITQWERNYVELTSLINEQNRPNYLTLIGSAQAKSEPIRPNTFLNSIISAAIGMILAMGLVVAREFLGDYYKTLSDLSLSGDLNPLGAIGEIKGSGYPEKLITHQDPFSPISESYRIVRSKLFRISSESPLKTLIITSPTPGDGKSVTAVNFSIALAQARFRTILIDADMRRSVLHRFFEVENDHGLSDLLNDEDPFIESCLKDTEIENLRIMTSGPEILSPSEWLGSDRMSEVLETLKKDADVIIIDSPPVLPVADVLELSNHVDGIMLVIRAEKTKRKDTKLAVNNLMNARAMFIGSVLNQVSKSEARWNYHGYYKKEEKGILAQILQIIPSIPEFLRPKRYLPSLPIFSGANGNNKQRGKLVSTAALEAGSNNGSSKALSRFFQAISKAIFTDSVNSVEEDKQFLQDLASKKRQNRDGDDEAPILEDYSYSENEFLNYLANELGIDTEKEPDQFTDEEKKTELDEEVPPIEELIGQESAPGGNKLSQDLQPQDSPSRDEPSKLEEKIVAIAFDNPALGQVNVSKLLQKDGIEVTPSYVRSIWLRHDLENFMKRSKALKEKAAEDKSMILTEVQLQALDRANDLNDLDTADDGADQTDQ